MSERDAMNCSAARRRPPWLRALRAIGIALTWLILALLTLWAAAALFIDFRWAALRIPLAVLYLLCVVVIVLKIKRRIWAIALCLACFCIVLGWWLSLKPWNTAEWRADVDRTAWAEINGDQLT